MQCQIETITTSLVILPEKSSNLEQVANKINQFSENYKSCISDEFYNQWVNASAGERFVPAGITSQIVSTYKLIWNITIQTFSVSVLLFRNILMTLSRFGITFSLSFVFQIIVSFIIIWPSKCFDSSAIMYEHTVM